MEELEKVKRENMMLKEALAYYQKKVPDVKPPQFLINNKQWEDEKTAILATRVCY